MMPPTLQTWLSKPFLYDLPTKLFFSSNNFIILFILSISHERYQVINRRLISMLLYQFNPRRYGLLSIQLSQILQNNFRYLFCSVFLYCNAIIVRNCKRLTSHTTLAEILLVFRRLISLENVKGKKNKGLCKIDKNETPNYGWCYIVNESASCEIRSRARRYLKIMLVQLVNHDS